MRAPESSAAQKTEHCVSDQMGNQTENPLDDFAASVSDDLPGRPLEVSDTSVGRLEGGQVRMRQSAARTLYASALHMDESAAGYVRAGSIDARESAVGLLTAREATLTDVTGSMLVAQSVVATNVRALFVFAARIEGKVQAVFTPMTAAAAGGGFALTLWLLRRLVRRPRG